MGELDKPQGSSSASYDLSGQPAPPTAQAQGAEAPAAAPAGGSPQAPAAAPAFSAPQVGQPQSQAPISTTPGSVPQINLTAFSRPTAPNEFYSGLFEPLGKQVEQGRQKLQEATAGFTQAAGPYRDFASAGGAGAIDAALIPGGDTEAARSLVGARYAGPGGLDQEAMDAITRGLTAIEPQTRNLTTYGGAEDLLKQGTAGLTRGQRRMETQRLLGDQGYRETAGAYQTAARDLLSDYSRAQEEARGIAEARTGQESGIARLAREDLTGRRSALGEGLEGRAQDLEAKDTALRDLYDAYTASGSAADLSALDAATSEDLSAFNTGTQARRAEAAQARAAIMADPRYASIASIPDLELSATRKGREALFLPKETLAKLQKEGKTKAQIKEVQSLARQRQVDLERLFSPGTNKRAGATTKEHMKAGEFADVAPMYFTKDRLTGQGIPSLDPEDPRSYIDFNEGVLPTRANVGTPEEQTRYNLIAELLGSPDRLESGLPLTPAGLESDAERYTTTEAARKAELERRVAGSKKDWADLLKGKRSRYQQSERFTAKGGRIGGSILAPGVGGRKRGLGESGITLLVK
jgi:hypothetical protein